MWSSKRDERAGEEEGGVAEESEVDLRFMGSKIKEIHINPGGLNSCAGQKQKTFLSNTPLTEDKNRES